MPPSFGAHDEPVMEEVEVARCFPDFLRGEDGGVDAYDVVMKLGHGAPPVVLEVTLEWCAVGSVVVDGLYALV